MKHLIRIVSVCLVLMAASAADAQISVRLGGGLAINPSRPGGHVSFDFPLSEQYQTFLAPFFEFYSKDGVRHIPAGASLLYKAALSEHGGLVYFGAGAGVLMQRGTLLEIEEDPNIGPVLVITEPFTEAMLSVAGGAQVGLGERAGVFVQARWFRSMATGGNNEIAFQAGVYFNLGAY